MPQAPYALVRASIAGGAVQTGGITATGGQTCQLSADPAGLAGATQYLWEILDYPPGFSTPSGWTLESDGRLTSSAQTPPVFTLDANAARWGKYIFRLTLNGGGPAITNRSTIAQIAAILALTDESTAVRVLSANGQPDIAFGETTQFGGRRGWLADLKTTLRLLETALGALGGTLDHGALTGLSDDDHTQYRLARESLSSYTAASNDLALTDERKCIISTRATAISLRIRLQATVAWLSETVLGGINTGAGTLTITAEGGVTLNGPVTVAQNGWWWAKRTALNTWQVFTGGTAGGVSDHGALTGLTDDDHPQYTLADGTRAFTGDINLGGHQVTNAADAGSATALTTLQQVQALIAAGISTIFDVKQSVRVATTGVLPPNARASNVITASFNGALPSQDGVSLSVNDRLLVKDEAAGANRGVYVVTSLGSAGSPWVLTRASDADTNAEVTPGFAVWPEEGTQKGHIFILTTPAPFTVNTSAWTFGEIQPVVGDGSTIQLSSGVLSVIAGSIGTTQLAAASVTAAKMANAAIDLAGSVPTGTLPFGKGGTGFSSYTKGEMLIYNGTTFDRVGIETGTDFSDSSVSIDVTGGYRYTKPASVTLTVPRTITVNATGASAGDVMWLDFYSCGANQYTINNGGSGGSSAMSFTTPTSGDYRYAITFDGVDWGTPRRSKLKVN